MDREDIELDIRVLKDDLIAACNSLGQLDANDGVYMKDRDCKTCLKEVIRALNNDDKQHSIRCLLGDMNIINSDLIPIINQYCDFNDGDIDLFNLVLRLCTNLTSSALLLFEHQEIPNEPEAIKTHNKLNKGLYKYKKSFAHDVTIWETLNVHLRHTEDEVPFERLLVLMRNILHIPVDSTGDGGIKSEFDAHDMCIHWMNKSGVLQTIIEIASETQRGTEFCFHIMEIVYLLLRDKNPVTIAVAKSNNCKRMLEDEDPDKKKLAELRAKERGPRVNNLAVSRFRNSAFLVQNVRSISDAPIVTRNIHSITNSAVFDTGKTDLRRARNRKPFESEKSSTALSDRDTRFTRIAYELKSFCKQFVEKIYANYMQQIKHNLIQKKAAENDESYYLWAIQFFVAFSRHLYMPIDNISETLSSSTLHFIQMLINDYQDKLKIEKKRTVIERISKRMHLALRAYREILLLIQSIDRKTESDFKSTVEQIKKKIYSEVEYNSMILSMFQQYEDHKYCSDYLRDLILTNEVFLALSPGSMPHYYCSDIIRAHASVLKDFQDNSSELNAAILKYFEKLVFDSQMEVMLMQASFLKTLMDIIDYGHLKQHERYLNLAKQIMSKFVTMVAIEKKSWMYQELLFWKSGPDVLEIERDESQILADNAKIDKESGDEENVPGDYDDDHEIENNPDDDVERLRDELFGSDEEESDAQRGQIKRDASYTNDLPPLSQISGVDDGEDDFMIDIGDDKPETNTKDETPAIDDDEDFKIDIGEKNEMHGDDEIVGNGKSLNAAAAVAVSSPIVSDEPFSLLGERSKSSKEGRQDDEFAEKANSRSSSPSSSLSSVDSPIPSPSPEPEPLASKEAAGPSDVSIGSDSDSDIVVRPANLATSRRLIEDDDEDDDDDE